MTDEKNLTKRLILRKYKASEVAPDADVYLVEAKGVESHSASQAIQKTATEAGTFVAVPERSWAEEPVYVETPAPVIRVGGPPGQMSLVDETALSEALSEAEKDAGVTV